MYIEMGGCVLRSLALSAFLIIAAPLLAAQALRAGAARGTTTAQECQGTWYGEVNSVGPDAASVVLQALAAMIPQ